jgi:hypothetical protein
VLRSPRLPRCVGANCFSYAVDTAQHPGRPADAWWRVRELDPGTEIILTVRGLPLASAMW